MNVATQKTSVIPQNAQKHAAYLKARKKQAGFGLIEIALALIIIAIMIGFAVNSGASKQDTANGNAEAQNFVTAANQLKSQAQSQGNFTGFSIDNIALSFGRNKTGTTVDSNWATGAITLGTVTATALPIVYNLSIPAAACPAFIGAIQGTANKILVQATAGAAATAANTVKDLTAATPLNYSAALTATACNANTSSGNVAATIQLPVR